MNYEFNPQTINEWREYFYSKYAYLKDPTLFKFKSKKPKPKRKTGIKSINTKQINQDYKIKIVE